MVLPRRDAIVVTIGHAQANAPGYADNEPCSCYSCVVSKALHVLSVTPLTALLNAAVKVSHCMTFPGVAGFQNRPYTSLLRHNGSVLGKASVDILTGTDCRSSTTS